MAGKHGNLAILDDFIKASSYLVLWDDIVARSGSRTSLEDSVVSYLQDESKDFIVLVWNV